MSNGYREAQHCGASSTWGYDHRTSRASALAERIKKLPSSVTEFG
jgi:hypothetical protein